MRFKRRYLYSAKPYLISVAVTLGVLCLVLEIWAHVFLPYDKSQVLWPSRHDRGLGFTFQRNAIVHWTNGLDFGVTEKTNEAGFVDRPLPKIENPARRCRIAIIGDSYVEALQVRISEKVQVLLETISEQAFPGLDVETMAFGFSGTGQVNQLPYYDHLARPRQPDVVVLVFVKNDYANNSRLLEAVRKGWDLRRAPLVFAREDEDGVIGIQPIAADWARYRLPRIEAPRPWLHEQLHLHSRFYRWFFAKLSLRLPVLAQALAGDNYRIKQMDFNLRQLKLKQPEIAAMFDSWDPHSGRGLAQVLADRDPLPPAFAQTLRFTRFGFAEYKRRAIEDGFELLVLSTHGVRGRHQARLRTMLEDLEITYLSQRDYIKSLGQPVQDAHWRHDGHWSQKGHIWAAEQLMAHFSKRGLCGRQMPLADSGPIAPN